MGVSLLQEHQNLEHFVVMVPQDETIPVTISEYWRWIDSELLRDEDLWSRPNRLCNQKRDAGATPWSSGTQMPPRCWD